MVSVGGIVSVGSTGGSGGSGSSSGIQEINGQIGPVVTLVGTSGIIVEVVAPNVINIGISGTINTTQSGVIGVNGITVHQVGGNFVVDGASLSGLISSGNPSGCYSAAFSPTTSGQFNHNLGTRNLVIEVRDDGGPPRSIIPDAIIFDTLDTFSLLFNTPQGGSVTAVTCGSETVAGNVSKYTLSFIDQLSVTASHNLGTEDIMVQVFDSTKKAILPDEIEIIDVNSVTVRFNALQSGKIVIVG